MLDGLEPILPHIQNIALAIVLLFTAYLLALPLRRHYGPSDGTESRRRSSVIWASHFLKNLWSCLAPAERAEQQSFSAF